jgi:hypothetical protein
VNSVADPDLLQIERQAPDPHPNPHQRDKLDPDPHPHPHQRDKLDPDPHPDPHQFADKPNDRILAYLRTFSRF